MLIHHDRHSDSLARDPHHMTSLSRLRAAVLDYVVSAIGVEVLREPVRFRADEVFIGGECWRLMGDGNGCRCFCDNGRWDDDAIVGWTTALKEQCLDPSCLMRD
jgi:hypothetical protein